MNYQHTLSWRVLIVFTFALVVLFAGVSYVHAEGDELPPVVEVQQPTVEEQQPPAEDPQPQPEGESAPDGEAGEPGENAGSEAVDPEPAIIETGDAGAGVAAGTDANYSDISSLSGDLTATTTNDATIDNDTEASAETGDNTAASPGGAIVDTGTAAAFANVINVANTNIINSTGLLAFLNYIFGSGFDLRALGLDYFLNPNGSGGCSLSGCADDDVTINTTNNATITNDVIVHAATGGNTAEGGNGGAYIETGDAYAAANLINVVNSSLIGSNYLLVVGNNFGSLSGDITLPGADFFAQLFSQSPSIGGPLDVSVNNGAEVAGTTTAEALTGDNTATGDGAVVLTGNAVAGGTSANVVNTTEVGGTSFMFLINVIGEWTGNVYGLPDGIGWTRTASGVALMSTGGDLSALGGGCCDGGSTTVHATNTATVANNVSVYALTGDNYAGGGDGGSFVDTGNAYAAANSVNIVNTNILGRNWIFAIFNIFGDWTGNVSFGHPDLWVGAVAKGGNPTRPNSPVEYCFTVTNMGDADAHNVILLPEYSTMMVTFLEHPQQFGNRVGWPIGDLRKRESKEKCYQATTNDLSPGRSVAVPLTITADAEETEEDMSDNSDVVTIVVESFLPESLTGAGRAAASGDPKVTIKKSVSVSTTTIPATVDYTIVVRNTGSPVYKGRLTDKLVDPNGDIVYDRSWDLDTVFNGDEITLTYSIEFNSGLTTGIYTNTAIVTGRKGNRVDVYATDLKPVSTTALVELTKGEPQVLGAVAPLPDACAEYITDYIRPGAKNKVSQVKRLQYFLRDYEGESEITPDGLYGPTTIAAVNRFQERYAEDVLEPWGLYKPSGYLYYTTRKKINDIYCAGKAEFPLDETQESEIIAYKSTWLQSFAEAPQPKAKAPEAAPAYVRPSVLNAPIQKIETEAAEASAQSFFEKLFNFGKSAFVIPEVNAQGLF